MFVTPSCRCNTFVSLEYFLSLWCRPDGSVQVLETYEKRPLLRDASKRVREYSFEKFAIFNDRYAKGFGGRL